MWRLVLEKTLTYTEACKMSHHELFEANAALDIHIEKINRLKGATK